MDLRINSSWKNVEEEMKEEESGSKSG